MQSDVVVCDGCFKRICKMNVPAGTLWMDLCELAPDGQLLVMEIEDIEELRILELMGHIVTSETQNEIRCRLVGDKEGYFCNGKCDENL